MFKGLSTDDAPEHYVLGQGSVHFICYPKPKKEEKQDENTDKQTA